MATTDLYATVFFQDGEQFTFGDANNMQRFVRAQLTDQVLQQLIGSVANSSTRPDFGGDDGADVSTLWAYCVSPGRAFLRQGSANNKIQVAPGTLLQKIANADGNDSTLVPFTFVGTEEWTIASGDATNPRVDLLQMSLAYVNDTLASVDFQDAITRANTTTANTVTRRRLQCTLSVKQGTPNASPTIPDPDTGCVPVGTAVVGHGWTSAGAAPIFGLDTAEANKVVIHDQRMPLGVRSLIVSPLLYQLETAWALQDVNSSVHSSSGTNLFWVRCPTVTGRLIAVDVNAPSLSLSGVASLGHLIPLPAGTPPSAFYMVSNGFGSNTTLSGSLARARRIDIDGNHVPTVGPTIQQSATNKIGVPLWASGYRTPQVPTGNARDNLYLRIQNTASGANIAETTFYIAG